MLLHEATNSFTGSAGQQRVPISFLQSYIIPVPSLEIQKKTVQILDERFAEWETHQQELHNIQKRHELIKKHLSSITSSILNQAFIGKLLN